MEAQIQRWYRSTKRKVELGTLVAVMKRKSLLLIVSTLLLVACGYAHAASSQEAGVTRDMVIYVVNPTRNLKILPRDGLIAGEISTELKVVASPGEYEPASFVIAARSHIKSLKVTVSDLSAKATMIPSSAVDVRTVKCWFQGRGKGLVPELLLHDDGLVKVDLENGLNFLKLRLPEGEKYVSISDPQPPDPGLKRPVPPGFGFSRFAGLLDPEKYPVKDSPHLLPVDIPSGENKQFWVTVKVPEDGAEGLYTGRIRLSAEGIAPVNVSLTLRVLPLKLLPPYYTSAIYYGGRLDPTNRGSISMFLKSELQFRRELENMVAHGVTEYVLVPSETLSDAQRKKQFEIRREAGMNGTVLYTTGANSAASKPEDLLALKDRTMKTLELAKSYGFTDVYFYGLDEAKGDRLTSQRQAWQAVREGGGKVFVSGYLGRNVELMGDIQDLLIAAYRPSKEEAARWHAKGQKIWSYANPQGGVENPEVYRRNFGLLLWKNDYDGAATWAYQSTNGNVWNDFDTSGRGFRKDVVHRSEYNFTYPTVDGVVDTVQWEGYREGVDDVRYVTTLMGAIETARQSGDAAKRDLAASAEKYLHDLKNGDAIETGSLDAIRLTVIDHLLRLARPRPRRAVSSTLPQAQQTSKQSMVWRLLL